MRRGGWMVSAGGRSTVAIVVSVNGLALVGVTPGWAASGVANRNAAKPATTRNGDMSDLP
jgi:hypothetical protein